ncbi:GNAT family N-acetyltransferase [Actinoplanes sp. NBRC 103695]|uniref:GNAT family N-acetyltransferase n=1 Tax=Actinoplanes sp. NBRC 103695 TaxID=3032202 RepID=UPI002553EB89|nr:GNAT family N-acetyltransferase [Actinoplanes sp. NBRC 103695]
MDLLVRAEDAAADAEVAAAAANVHVRILSDLDDLHAAQRLFDDIWQPDPANRPMTAELLRALSKAGNYVAAAFDDSGMVGACAGFFAPPAQRELHSHIAGVAGRAMGRSVGLALKLHQRAWCLRHGVDVVTWTFDPLVARNAWFNLAKLGGVPVQYLPNFYGSMHDGINGGDDTDRLLLRWELTAPRVDRAVAGVAPRWDVATLRRAGAVVGLDRSPSGEPLPGRVDGDTVLVAAPRDIESLRKADPECARLWRTAVRDVLEPLFASGAAVPGFDRSGWYVVRRGGPE